MLLLLFANPPQILPGPTSPGRVLFGRRIFNKFEPVEALGAAWFWLDFTPDVGPGLTADYVQQTSWTCAFSGPSGVSDPSPSARINLPQISTSLQVMALDGRLLITRSGMFSGAFITGAPFSAIGGTYAFEATLVMKDGRIFTRRATAGCIA